MFFQKVFLRRVALHSQKQNSYIMLFENLLFQESTVKFPDLDRKEKKQVDNQTFHFFLPKEYNLKSERF